MPTRLRSSQVSGQFCIMAFCICHLPLLAWRLPFFEMKLPLFYGKFPHFPHCFPHFPYLMGYAHLAKLLYGALLLGCKLNIILNGKRTSLRWCG